MKSSEKALDLITSEETGGQVYYRIHYEHFDFPGGASGPTIADGYDCGYATPGEATADWTGVVPAEVIAHIVAACGLRGEAAHEFVRARGTSVTILWDQAMQEFREREVPKQEAELDAALPNTDLLSGDSYGALLSLSLNRGPSFSAVGPRYAEMRAIKAHMAAKAFELIPAEFLSMRRLWPTGGDLWRRRGHEADLFRAGLNLPPVSGNEPRPIPVRLPGDRSTRALQARLNDILAPVPRLDVDGVCGEKTVAVIKEFQDLAGLAPVDGIAGHDTWAALDSWNRP